ncbi:MAG: eukaryotic-like serine/threonine-protein kinase [Kribbellaceae bacterium]|nr:eukaryotic-like serine/threonine-protein kinase [Kribbellaceae bacterium]
MGEVFRAVDEQLGRPVAVKLMLPSDRDPRAVERFHREARSAAMLNDPHVVAVYDFGQHGDQFFLVMELVEGRTVGGELTEHGPLPKDRAIDIVEQAAAGLAAAHRENVVHRDVKPGNLLLTPDGTVKVADFGIAHRPDDGSTALTATGQLIGSALYLAPERAKGGQGGQPSDVYSLGCVLYQLLTGQPPFTAEHPTAILYQHVDAVPAPPSAVRPELAGPFEAELFRMLAKEPADRPTAAAIAAGSLRAPALATTAVVPAPTVLAATVPAGPVEPLPVQPSPSGWGGRQKALLAGGIALAAAAAAVLVGVILNNNDPKSPTTDIGPGPGAVSTTPGPTITTTSNSGSTQATQPTRSTSTRPSQTPSRQSSPTPTPSSTPTTSSQPPTSTPTTPPKSTPPTTSDTPPPTTAPSSTPPPDNTPTPPPASGTPGSQ